MKKFLLALAFAFWPAAVFAACPVTTLTFKDAGGVDRVLCFGGTTGEFIPQYQLLGDAPATATSGLTGKLAFGATTTSAPTYTTAQSNPLSLTVAGDLRAVISNTSFAATQSGTWTVQPGNTANTTAWKVDGSAVTQPVSGTFFQATQPVSAASLPLPALASTSTKQSDGTQKTQIVDGSGSVIASTSNNLNVQCANCSGSGVSTADEATFTAGTSLFAGAGAFFQTTATSNALTDGQQGMLQATANRALFTNLRSASGVEIGTAAVPVQVSVANTAANASAIKTDGSAVTQPVSASALPLPALAATSTKQSDGTQKSQIVDGSGNVIASTSNNLNVQCANCSGSGVSAVDGASFTATSSVFAPAGGFFQTTATTNPLATGQQGMAQMTANRALFSNLRNAAGTEVGTATTPIQVSLANTAANGTAVKTDGSAVTQPVSGTFWQATQPVSGTVTVNGALTANQSVNVAQVNGVTTLMGNGVTGTGSQRVTVASDNTPFAVKTDLTTPGTTDAVSIARVGTVAVVTGGVNGSLSVGGPTASGSSLAANPLTAGGRAQNAEATAVTNGQVVNSAHDLVGKQIVLPYSNPENFVSGVITTAMTSTTTTSLIAAPAAGLRNYITHIVCSNAHATVSTDIVIQDGSGGTTFYLLPAAAVYGGASLTLPTPLRQPTTATAVFVANVTTGASTKCAASGYKGV